LKAHKTAAMKEMTKNESNQVATYMKVN